MERRWAEENRDIGKKRGTQRERQTEGFIVSVAVAVFRVFSNILRRREREGRVGVEQRGSKIGQPVSMTTTMRNIYNG